MVSDLLRCERICPMYLAKLFSFMRRLNLLTLCTRQEICHRDLKLENTLLDGNPVPRLKICDFGYSKVISWFLCVGSQSTSVSLRMSGHLSSLLAISIVH